MPKKHQRSTGPAAWKAPESPRLLSGGNPQIAMGYGDEPVQAYIAAMPGWKREVGQRIDRLIVDAVPDLRKAVKWNSPLYGAGDRDWFLTLRCYTRYVQAGFLNGAALKPQPPKPSKDADVRYLDIGEGELDEAQFADWVRQASRMPGQHL